MKVGGAGAFPHMPAQESHVVKKGDTLESLAARYNVTPEALGKANNLKPGQELRAGRGLIIPAQSQGVHTGGSAGKGPIADTFERVSSHQVGVGQFSWAGSETAEQYGNQAKSQVACAGQFSWAGSETAAQYDNQAKSQVAGAGQFSWAGSETAEQYGNQAKSQVAGAGQFSWAGSETAAQYGEQAKSQVTDPGQTLDIGKKTPT